MTNASPALLTGLPKYDRLADWRASVGPMLAGGWRPLALQAAFKVRRLWQASPGLAVAAGR
jgi:hypothetical protein